MVEDNRGTAKIQSGDSAHDSQWLDNTKTLKSLAFCMLVALAAATVRAETRYGLFVGVNEFEYTSNLSACDWDAARMYDAYTTGGTCASANASLFVNRKAKKEDVRAKFSELAGKAKSGDTVLYYQSSHGGNNPDADGNDTKDAYLCLTDDTYGDAEFAEDLQQFKDGVNVIVVLDACFSGGMFKAAGVTSVADLRKNGWNFATRVRKLMGKRKTSTKDCGNGPSVAFVTAANWDETSSEIGRQGEFTGAFLDGWESAAADADADGKVTFAELAEYAKPVVENSSVQTSNYTLLKSIVAGQAFDVVSYRLLYADGILAGFFGTCPLSVAVADGTTEICWSAFNVEYNGSATNLTSVTIPASVAKIGQYAFYGCENLETVTFKGDFAAIDCPRDAFYGTPVSAALFPPPANDEYENAQEISGASGSVEGTLENATITDNDAIWYYGYAEKTVWYKWMSPKSGRVVFTATDAVADLDRNRLFLVAVRGYDAENGEWSYCGYDYGSNVAFDAEEGVTYYISLATYDENTAGFALNWKFATRPVNDAFADTIVLFGAIGMTNGWNYLATNTDAIDELANLGKATVWWAWTAPETDAYEFNTFGSRFDTKISVLKHIEGDDYGYDVVAANDDANNSGYNESAVYFSAVAGVTYYIGVSGYDEDEGDITLNWKKSVFSLTIEDGTLVGFTGLCPATLDISAEAITSIAERVFAECTSLRELILPESLASIGNGAFYGCENLETVVCANANWQEDAEVDVDSAFGGTPWLLGPLEMTVDEDGTLQVSGFVKGDIVIPDGTKIIPGSAFSGCHRLASVVIPSSVTHIGEEAFYECHALMNIEFVAKEPAIEPADEEGAADYTYFDDTLEIGDRAFCNTAIRSLEIPAHVSVVGNSAFESSHALTNVVFKSDDRLVDSYLDVGDYAFGECHCLVRVVFEPRVCDEGKEIWNQVNISGAFRNCSNLVELDLCAGISGFGADSIDGCSSLAAVNIAEGGQEYVSIDGMVYNRWADVDEEEDENGNVHVVTNAVKKYLVRCPEGKTGVVRLGLDICDINGDAFRNCTKLDKVQLPETFEGVLDFDAVFDGCDESIVEYYAVPHKVVTLDLGYDGRTLSKKVSTAGGFVGALPNPSRNGYVLTGWRTAASDDGWHVYGDVLASELDGISTLYACWSEIVYTWSYSVNSQGGATITGVTAFTVDGGYASPSGHIEMPDSIDGYIVTALGSYLIQYNSLVTSVRLPAGLVPGSAGGYHAFEYLNSLEIVYAPDSSASYESDLRKYVFYGCPESTVFEYYAPNIVAITLEAGDGAVLETTEVNVINVVGNLPVPVREGYDFMGWWTDAEGGEWISPGREVSADFTAYAHWQESEYNWSVQDYTDDSGNVIGVSITTGNWSPALSRIDGETVSGTVTVPYGINGQPVVAIGYCAFVNCSAIAEAVLPPTVQRIGNRAFAGCSGLSVVDIPDSVRYIDSDAFADSGIESVFIPASVNSIAGGYVFGNCRYLSEILVDENNGYYKSVDGVLYTKDGTTLVAWPGGRDGEAVVAEGTRTIGNYAFAYLPIISVVIPDDIERIEYNAFFSCSDLTAVDIPASVTYIGSDAFGYSGLLPDGVAIGNPNATVESTAFRNTPYEAAQPFSMIVDAIGTVTGFTGGCPETIDIGAEAEKLGVVVTAIGNSAFYGYNHDMTPLKSVVIPGGVTNIGDYAFYYCQNLESVVLPSTVQNIGNNAFYGCHALREIIVPASVESIGSYAFAYCNSLEAAYVPARLESMVQDASVFDGSDKVRVFYYDGDAPQFTSVTLKMNDGTDAEETVEVFQTLSGLPVPRRQDYTFTGWWTTADDSGEAVSDDTAAVDGMILYAHWMETIYEYNYYDNGDGVTLYRNGHYNEYGNWCADPCVSPKPYGRFVVPSEIGGKKVTQIDSEAFLGCGEMTEIVIPANVSSINIWAFNGCTALERIVVDEANPYYKSIDGMLYTKDGTTLVLCPRGRAGAVVIADGTREIRDNAVYDCDGIESVEIPDLVEYIGYQAFAYCDNLATVSGLNETNMYVAVNAFAYTPFERSRSFALVIENGAIVGFHGAAPKVLDIGEYLGGEVVTGIGSQAFSTWGDFEVGGITSVVVPEGVVRIEYGAFAYCGMASITLPSSLVSIGNEAFYGCSSLRRIRLPENVEEVSDTAFNECYNLTLIEAPKTLMGKISSPYGRIEYYDVAGVGVVVEVNGAAVEFAIAADGMTRTAVVAEGTTAEDMRIVSGGYDVTAGYCVKVEGTVATATLAPPVLPAVAGDKKDEADPSGRLVVVEESAISAKPSPASGESVGALPVDAVPGLYYQAAWGDDLDSLIAGERVRATGGTLYLGVIRQTGKKGFYKVSVSEK